MKTRAVRWLSHHRFRGRMPLNYINVLTGGTSGVYYPIGVSLWNLWQGHARSPRCRSGRRPVPGLSLLHESLPPGQCRCGHFQHTGARLVGLTRFFGGARVRRRFACAGHARSTRICGVRRVWWMCKSVKAQSSVGCDQKFGAAPA